MIHIDETKFGSVIIDGQKYHQVLIINEQIMPRDDEKLQKLFNTSHKIGDWELELLLSSKPEIIIVGSGQQGVLQVDEEIKNKIKDSNVELLIYPTPEAIEKYNRLIAEGKKVNALIHTTC